MDRNIVYPGGIGQDTDVLNLNRNVMVALGKLASAVLGTNTLVHSLPATPSSGLTVSIGAGQIYQLQNVDSNAYGSLAADTAHAIVKQGIMLDATVLTLAAPTTPGQSINYLIEATYSDSDTDNTALPFYNSANPTQPFSGMNNNGQALPTRRKGGIAIQAKAGTAAATGSQTTPAVDNGYVPLYVVTVAYGAASISQGNISTHPAAPFITETLAQKLSQATADTRYVQQANLQSAAHVSAPDTGSANAYAVNLTPALTSYALFTYVCFKAVNGNTGASTLNVNGLGAKTLVHRDGTPLLQGDIPAGSICEVVYDGANFQLLNLAPSAPVNVPVRQTALTGSTDSNGYANHTQPDAASGPLAARIMATAKPLWLAMAVGFGTAASGQAGAIDQLVSISADQPGYWNNLPANMPAVFLGVERNATTGLSSAVSTIVPPQVGNAYDMTKNALLHFDGANGATTTLDDFGNAWVLGSGSTISTAWSVFGGSSLRAVGTTSVTPLYCAAITSLTQNFTIEGRYRLDGVTTRQFLWCGKGGSYGTGVTVEASGKLALYLSSSGASWDIANGTLGTTVLTANTGYHLELTYDGSAYRLFLNGNLEVIVYSTTRVGAMPTGINVGNAGDNTLPMTGYIDEFRISSCARNTQPFTPPAAAYTVDGHFYSIPDGKMYAITGASTQAGQPPVMTAVQRVYTGETPTNAASALLHLSSNFSDDYGNAWTTYGSPTISALAGAFGGNAAKFNGSTDYLLQRNLGANFNPAAWCIEGRFNTASLSAAQTLFAFCGAANGFPTAQVGITTAGKTALYLSSNNSANDIANGTAGTTTLAANTSYHFALSFDGSAYRLFINGAVDQSVASTTKVYASAQGMWLGNNAGVSSFFNGYIWEFRISQQARYTAAFTPPAVPFTADESKLVNPISYAYQGKYDSGLFQVTNNTNYTKNHNLGVASFTTEVHAADDLAGTNERMAQTWVYDGTSTYGFQYRQTTRNAVTIGTAATYANLTALGGGSNSLYDRIIVRRAF